MFICNLDLTKYCLTLFTATPYKPISYNTLSWPLSCRINSATLSRGVTLAPVFYRHVSHTIGARSFSFCKAMPLCVCTRNRKGLAYKIGYNIAVSSSYNVLPIRLYSAWDNFHLQLMRLYNRAIRALRRMQDHELHALWEENIAVSAIILCLY